MQSNIKITQLPHLVQEGIDEALSKSIRKVSISDALRKGWSEHRFDVIVHDSGDISILIDGKHDISYDGDLRASDSTLIDDILCIIGEFFENNRNDGTDLQMKYD